MNHDDFSLPHGGKRNNQFGRPKSLYGDSKQIRVPIACLGTIRRIVASYKKDVDQKIEARKNKELLKNARKDAAKIPF